MLDKNQINKVSYGDINHRINYLQGCILTIIDAVIENKNQNKATKDLLKDRIGKCRNELWKIAIGERPSVYDTGERTIEKDIEKKRNY